MGETSIYYPFELVKTNYREKCKLLHFSWWGTLNWDSSIASITESAPYDIHNGGEDVTFLEEVKNMCSPRTTLPLQGAITSSFLSRWSLWHLTWQRRHSRAGGGLKTCHRGLEQASQLEGKWYSVGMNSWPLCGRQLVLSPCGTVSMSASFLHSPSLAYRIWMRRVEN